MRILRRLLRVLALLLVVLVLLVVGSVWVLLRTEWGRGHVKNIIHTEAAAIFDKGGFTFEELSGDLPGRFELRKVVVLDSHNAPMVTAERVTGELDLWAFLDNEARLRDVRAEGVTVRVLYDQSAVYYPIPKASEPSPEPSTFAIIIEDFTADEVHFEYTSEEGPPVYQIQRAAIRAGLHMNAERIKLYAYEARGLSDGLSAGLHLRGEMTYIADCFRVDWAEVGLGASRFFLHGEMREFANLFFDFTLDPSFLRAVDLRHLIPDLPILADLRATGAMRGHFGDLAVEGTLDALGGGKAHVRYVMNLYDPLVTWGANIRTENFDLANWFGGSFPHTALEIDAGAAGTGFGDGDVERFTLHGAGPVTGYPEIAATMTGSFRRGVLRIDEASLDTESGDSRAEGLYASQSGEGGLVADLDIPEIAALPFPLGDVSGGVAGRVSLLTSSRGLDADFDLSANRLRYEVYRTGTLHTKGKAHWKDDQLHAKADLHAKRIDLDGFLLESADAVVTPDPEAPLETFAFQAQGTLPTSESAKARGSLRLDGANVYVTLGAGSVSLGEGVSYQLAPGAQIDAIEDRARWSNLRLLSDGQRETLRSSGAYLYANGSLRGEAKTQGLPLAPLVRLYAGELPVSGALDLDATFEGPYDAPRFVIKSARLHDGQLADLNNVSLTLQNTIYDGKELSLNLKAEADGAPLIYSSARLPIDLYRLYLHGGPLDGVLQLDELDVTRLRPLLPESLADVEGTLVFTAAASGTGTVPRILGTFSLQDAALGEWREVGLTGRLNLAEDRVTASSSLSLSGVDLLSIRAAVGLPWEKLTGEVAAVHNPSDLLSDIPLDVLINLSNLEIAEQLPKLPATYRESIPLVAGLLDFDLNLTGTPRAPELTVHSELSDATALLGAGDISGLNADFDLLFSEGYLSLNGGASGLGGILSYEGSAEVDLGDLETQWKAGIAPEDLAAQVLFDVSASVIGLDLPTLPWKTLGVSPSYFTSLERGVLGADLSVSGSLGAPQIRYTVAVEDVEFWPQYRPGDLRSLDIVLDGSLDEKGIDASLSAAEGGAGFFTGDLALKLPLSDLLGADLASLPPPPISLSLKTVPLDAARLFALLEKRSEASGMVWATANVRGNLPLTWPAKLPGVDINFYGDKLSVDGISLVGKSLPSKERAPLFAARLQESTLTWNLDVSSTDGKSNLYSQGVLPLDLSAEIPLSPGTPISRAVLRAKRFDLALFALASPSVRSLRGILSTNGDLRVTGTVGQPNINGTISVFEGQLAIDGFPTFKDVTLRASFTPEEIELERLTVRAGKGEANINGSITLKDNRPQDFAFTLTANEFDVPYDGQSMAMLNDFESSLSGRFEESRLVSTLVMERGKFQLPSIFSDTGKDLVPLGSLEDVTFVSQHDAEVAALQNDTPESEAKPFFYELNLEIPGNFFITGAPPEAIGTVNSLRLELGGKLRIDAAPDSLSFVGEIKLLKGSELVIVDDNFVFSEESSLSFIGADLDPRLALEATAEVQDAANSYKVTLFIGGTASSPEIRITSDPFLEEGQIATLLLTGQAEGKAEGDASQTLRDGLLGTTDAITSAVVGVGVGALIQNTPLGDIKEYLKLDVLRLDSQQLEIGKYIGKKCYAGLKYRFLGTEATVGEDTSNRPEGNFICRIGRGWGLNGHYGGASKTGSTAAGIDVLWSKDY